MIKINERVKHGLRLVDIYYAKSNYDHNEYDVVFYVQNKSPIKGANEFHTILLDLEKSEEEIFAAFGKHLRRGIRKMEKSDEVEYFTYLNPSDEQIESFIKYFDDFSKNRGIYKCNRQNLYQLRDAGCLAIEGAIEKQTGDILVYHTYTYDEIRSRMQYSASLNYKYPDDNKKRNMICNVNRTLIFKGIKLFKEKGLKEFDFGGVTLDCNNKTMEGIDHFKMEFGGQIVTEYNYYCAKNSKGRMFLSLKTMQEKIRRSDK
ncbi:hypothetical protein [Anaerosacchariphilus polymeriproducens]|uniref:Peptidoglycan bridge formation glycyltransferase FemA/FemB family protein n=1 Tax=Anaerosacchariphilus polymeriproducens TaxID=1812858 RepID=A0A371AYW0_9FIRM|nr:hypothetical protein [Anaerosacchariphilus polymeriproducens]RDU24784.1 hypothetical protein DWV06_02070 [Anaerosacchariphilus polymeriproducens]